MRDLWKRAEFYSRAAYGDLMTLYLDDTPGGSVETHESIPYDHLVTAMSVYECDTPALKNIVGLLYILIGKLNSL